MRVTLARFKYTWILNLQNYECMWVIGSSRKKWTWSYSFPCCPLNQQSLWWISQIERSILKLLFKRLAFISKFIYLYVYLYVYLISSVIKLCKRKNWNSLGLSSCNAIVCFDKQTKIINTTIKLLSTIPTVSLKHRSILS